MFAPVGSRFVTYMIFPVLPAEAEVPHKTDRRQTVLAIYLDLFEVLCAKISKSDLSI